MNRRTRCSVGADRLASDQIFLNVGGRAIVPDMPGIGEVKYLTNSSMMDVDFLPEHLVIIGGSYIGLEFAQMFRRFGSEVTVIEMGPRLIAREDEDISAAIREILEAEGIQFRLNAKCIRLSKHAGGVGAGVDCQRGAPGSHRLAPAAGRRPPAQHR